MRMLLSVITVTLFSRLKVHYKIITAEEDTKSEPAIHADRANQNVHIIQETSKLMTSLYLLTYDLLTYIISRHI